MTVEGNGQGGGGGAGTWEKKRSEGYRNGEKKKWETALLFTYKKIHRHVLFLGWTLCADSVTLHAGTITSYDQFKPIRIAEN